MTVQDIYDRAVERSNLNDATLVSQDEWVNYISTAEQSIYLEAAQHNPDFFGREAVTASRSYELELALCPREHRSRLSREG